MITVSKIVPKHTADRQPMVVTEFFLTTSHELLLMGFCSKCREPISFTIPIQDLIDNCPVEKYTMKDISDLHQLGVCLPPEPAPDC